MENIRLEYKFNVLLEVIFTHARFTNNYIIYGHSPDEVCLKSVKDYLHNNPDHTYIDKKVSLIDERGYVFFEKTFAGQLV
jgi:hypothetical protein